MNGYENAPATKLLATHCCVCARPLVDSKSVELGIGPECRKKCGFDMPCDEASRVRANWLVYQAAAHQTDGALVAGYADELKSLGFTKLAERLLERVCQVIISEEGTVLLVATTYLPEAVDSWRRIPGRFFHKDMKVNAVPVSQRAALWSLLKAHYAGALAYGPKGTFVV